ncbi:S26 family signal peptidase [Pseudomonas sp. DP16D-R1]|jgi:conjugal transfer pilin signal peptidase TrbI|uniref:S26 family signal peptidase n=1 Tax=Pseudomonas sp. DP16D-R1 TaxID=2075551 RepID=UPI000CD06ECC|nr:S26 family signal peptidase [Pseudomonas sp. DP16D-R1]POA78522.1 signal peptidase I [Pseudomonas sp. DP16D-R1]
MNKHARFMIRALPLTALMVAASLYVTTRYGVGIDPQKNTCLDWRVFIIDKHNTSVERDGIYAFKSTQMEPYFRNGTVIIKYARGVTGDRVTVNTDQISINGTVRGQGLLLADKLDMPTTRYVRDEIVPLDKFWFMGTSSDSFDSRYWGYVGQSEVIGKAYPIW